jgi:hypothetical protein
MDALGEEAIEVLLDLKLSGRIMMQTVAAVLDGLCCKCLTP